MLKVEDLRNAYRVKKIPIQNRLEEFRQIRDIGDDKMLFRELVFCILTAGTSAELGLKVIPRIENVIFTGSRDQIRDTLKGIYRFYNLRSDYIFHTREYIKDNYSFHINEFLTSAPGHTERRDELALNKNIKGIGFKEASHFLRNVGYRGYTILDKHIIDALYKLGVINERKVPATRNKYLEVEEKFIKFSNEHGFDIDELDLLLWSEKTGKILK